MRRQILLVFLGLVAMPATAQKDLSSYKFWEGSSPNLDKGGFYV